MAQVNYNSVSTVDASGGGGTAMSGGATPADFGGQIGAATEKAGNDAFEIEQKQQGMLNEAAYTNADTQMAIKAGEINGEYKSLTGFAAKAAFPKYQQDLQDLQQQTRATLTNSAAQRGFDMLSTRTIANHIIDGSNYAATQFKEGMRDTFSSSTDLHIQQALNPSMTDDQFQHNLGVIKYNTQAQIDDDHPGLTKDAETGNVSFDESTPAGKTGKAQYQQNLDTNISQAYTNRYSTLMKQDVTGAYDSWQQERADAPRPAQVAVDSMFAPKIFDANKQTVANATVADAQRDHYDMLTNPGPTSAINTVLKNEGGMSPDGHAIYGIDKNAHLAEFLEAQSIAQNQGDAAGKKYAADFYKDQYWDKNNIGDLPANTQSIVMDGAVNHTQAFTNQLITAAKDGASPQQLIDMRRNEYQRLADANPTKYGADLAGWNNRLDSFGTQSTNQNGQSNLQQSTEGQKTYATNQNGGPLTLADYYRTHSNDVLTKGDTYAESQMPGDLAFKRAVRQTLQNQMNQTISNESAQHLMDNRNIMKAINGDMTKGQPPQTEDELRKLPGMSDLLDSVAARDPKFAETIPTLVAKSARRNDVTNSPNAYDVVQRTLLPHGSQNPDAISSEDHLTKELSRTDEGGINMKDYADAKPAIELPDTLKTKISAQMKTIANANGNLDGQGNQRAMAWYNETMKSWQGASGDEKPMSAAEFAQSFGKKDGPVPMPDGYIVPRMQAISDAARASFAKANGGQILMRNKDGVTGWVPQENVEKAGSLGYQKVQ